MNFVVRKRDVQGQQGRGGRAGGVGVKSEGLDGTITVAMRHGDPEEKPSGLVPQAAVRGDYRPAAVEARRRGAGAADGPDHQKLGQKEVPAVAAAAAAGERGSEHGLIGLGQHKGPAMEDDLDGGLASDDY